METMRKKFAVIFTFIARFIVVLLAVLTVIATMLVVLLSSLDHTLFKAGAYKRALLENKVYEQLPALVSEQFPTAQSLCADPCAENSLVCAIQGASPALQACLTKNLDKATLEAIGSGRRKPTTSETQTAQACLDQYATPSQDGSNSVSADEGLLEGASEQIRACVRKALGEEIYSAIHNSDRPATAAEIEWINSCMEEIGATLASNRLGLSMGQMALLRNLTTVQWQALILHLLPANDVQAMTETALDEGSAYLKGEIDTVKMPLTPLRARLTGPAGEELIGILLKSQPSCTKEQQVQINAGNFGNAEQTPIYCAAEGEALRKLSAELRKRLKQAASEIPKDAILIKPSEEAYAWIGWSVLGKNPRAARQKFNAGIRLSPLLPLCLLLLVAFFGVRSLRGWMRWWSIPIFLAGLIALSIGVAGVSRFDWAWEKYVVPEIPPAVGSNLSDMGRELAHALVNDLAIRIMLEAGVVALLALGVIVGSFYVKPPPDSSLPPLALPGMPGGPVLVQPLSKHKQK